ncbi:MAG: PorT family protein [Chitinispirillia bacterium]|nr:PorT family protein [Chitinispirillia bacterium]
MRCFFSTVRLRTLMAVIGVCLSLGLVTNQAFAQGTWGGEGFLSVPSAFAEDAPAAEDVAAPAAEPVAAESAPYSESEESVAVNVSEDEESVAADLSEDEAEEAYEAQSIPMPTFIAAPEPEPVVEVAEEEPAIEEAEEEVAVEEAPVKKAKAEKVKKCKAPKEPKEVSEGGNVFRCGLRAGLGVSAFDGHKAIYTESFGSSAVSLGPFVSASVGLVFSAPVTELISIAWEVQYSLYTAHGEFSIKRDGRDFGEMHQAGVELHTVEMPILANFNFGDRYYAELGPQVGWNFYGKIYANRELKKPYLNDFAFGPALGFGMKVNSDLAVGVRGYYNVLEYAENSNGYPWTVQGSITTFFSCKK